MKCHANKRSSNYKKYKYVCVAYIFVTYIACDAKGDITIMYSENGDVCASAKHIYQNIVNKHGAEALLGNVEEEYASEFYDNGLLPLHHLNDASHPYSIKRDAEKNGEGNNVLFAFYNVPLFEMKKITQL